MGNETSRYVAVIGAGPAGIFAARELANNNHKVTIINRDIKPGGLAEYGIYPTKQKIKEGLRKQFYSTLSLDSVSYFGNLVVGENADLSLQDLRDIGFDAILVTTGAQGTKWLGLPGENLIGSYHAKDLVYHYNQLPPFSSTDFHIGKKVAIIGVGNVMLDIARYLITDKRVEEVTAIARRGPAEVKFTRKELEYIVKNLDMDDYLKEIDRVTPLMTSLGQDPSESIRFIRDAYPNAEETNSDTAFRIKFLASPVRLVGNENDEVAAIELEENTLVLIHDKLKARGTGNKQIVEVHTVIFAIGDTIDPAFGLPFAGNEFVKNSNPRFPINGTSYESYDPEAQKIIEDVFLAGWARKASDGLVGNARKDGVNAAQVVDAYLKSLTTPFKDNGHSINMFLTKKHSTVVSKNDLQILLAEENKVATLKGIDNFKFSTNEEMLSIISQHEVSR